MKLAHAAIVFASLLVAAGCGSSDSDSGGAAGSGGSAGAGGGGSDGGDCTSPARWIESLDVELKDANGAPLPGVTVYCCGTNICSAPETTGADGKAHVAVNTCMKKPAFKVLGNGQWESFAAPIPDGQSAASFPATTLVALPTDGVAFATDGQPQTVASNGVSLQPPGAVQIDDLSLPDANDQKFRAVEIPMNEAPPIVDASTPLDAMWSLAPLATTFDPPAWVSVPNTLGWPAGTQVDVYLHGVEADEVNAPYGGWKLVGTGTVNTDHDAVELDGLPALSTIGLKKK